jgi:hypothetical protein
MEMDGTRSPIQLDTGNSGGVFLFKSWAEPHGFPGTRSVLNVQAIAGAGTAETNVTYFRMARASLGNVRHDGRLVLLGDPPGAGVEVAGLVGNDVFSRCPAVVFDVPSRKLWLDGPCHRASPESLAGWKLDRQPDPRFKDRPWVVQVLISGGSAEVAGLQRGDRILDVGGAPAVLDVSRIEQSMKQEEGTVVPVTIARQGAMRKVQVKLRRVLTQ